MMQRMQELAGSHISFAQIPEYFDNFQKKQVMEKNMI